MTEFTFLYRMGCPYCIAAEKEWVRADQRLEEMRMIPSPMKIVKDVAKVEEMKKKHSIQTFPAFLLKREEGEERLILISEKGRTEKRFLLFALS